MLRKGLVLLHGDNLENVDNFSVHMFQLVFVELCIEKELMEKEKKSRQLS